MLIKIQKYDEAEQQLKSAYERYSSILGTEHSFTQDTLKLLIELYDVWGKPEKAEEYRALLVHKSDNPPKDEDSEE